MIELNKGLSLRLLSEPENLYPVKSFAESKRKSKILFNRVLIFAANRAALTNLPSWAKIA